MGRASRDKGSRGEIEVRNLFRSYGFDCDRTPNSGALRVKADLYGNIPLHVEVKFCERPRIIAWVQQALSDASGVPEAVFWRRSRMRWRADVDGELFVRMLAELDARGVSLKP
jgi:hypothetical protein